MKNLDPYLGNKQLFKFEYLAQNAPVPKQEVTSGCIITMAPHKKPKTIYRRKNIIIEDFQRAMIHHE